MNYLTKIKNLFNLYRGRGRISNEKWAPNHSSAILVRKVSRVLLKQI